MIAFVYIGSLASFIWGVAHITVTKPVVEGFGALSEDNRRILTMEWIAEGFALCFIGILGALVALVGEPGEVLFRVVLLACAGVLFAFAVLAGMTGARTSQIPFRVCPFIEGLAGALFAIGSFG